MKKHLIFSTIITLALSMTSCGMFSNKNLAKRYRNKWNSSLFAKAPKPELFVQVDCNSTNIAPSQNVQLNYNIFSLSEKGQAEFIKAMNAKTPGGDAEVLLKALSTNFPLAKKEKTRVRIIPRTVKKSISFTVDRLQYQQQGATTIFNLMGDRIAYLQLDVRISDKTKTIYNSWDKYVTDKMTLNLGKVSSAQSWNASLNLSAKAGGEVTVGGSNTKEGFNSDKNTSGITVINPDKTVTITESGEILETDKGTNVRSNGSKVSGELGGSGTIGFNDKYETSLDLSSTVLRLSGSLSEDKMTLRQEGGPSIDLSGNVIVSVEYYLKDEWAAPVRFDKFEQLYNGDLPLDLSALKYSMLTVIFPDIQNDVKGQLDYSFLYRQVNSGNRHLPEARQRVKFWYGKVAYNANPVLNGQEIGLIKMDDVRPKAYLIKSGVGELNLNTKRLQFESMEEALSFLRYVQDLWNHGKPTIGLKVNASSMTQTIIDNLKIVTQQL